MAETPKKLIVKESNAETENLTRNYLFTPPIQLGEWRISTIEGAYWTIYLCHHGLVEEARAFNKSVVENPAGAPLKAWNIVENLGMRQNPVFILNGPKNYHSIFTFLMQHRANAFFLTMTEIYRKYGPNVEFLVAGSPHSKIWTCAKRQDEQLLNGRYGGFNLYGIMLGRILREYGEGESYAPNLQPDNFFIHAEYISVPYQYTALIISDSQFSQVLNVDGARVKALPGATFPVIAEWLNTHAGNLEQYRYVVVNVGINDAQREPQQWENLIKPFCDILKRYTDAQHLSFVINGPIGLPEVPNAANFTQFCENRFMKIWIDSDAWHDWIHYIDFTTRNGNRIPLLTEDGRPIKMFFREETRNEQKCWFHINQRGFGAMWNVMCERACLLKGVSVSMTKGEEKYPHGKSGP